MTFKSGAMIAATVATMLTGFAGCGDEKTTYHDPGNQVRRRQRLRRHERVQGRRQERVPGDEFVRRHGVHHHRDAGRLRRGPRGRQARGRRRPRSPGPTSCLGRWRGDTASAFAFRTIRRSLNDGVRGVDFVEAVTENFLGRGGRPRAVLERVRRDVPVVLHGVSLSIGGVSPLNREYLRALRALCDGSSRPSFRTTSASAPGVDTTVMTFGRCPTPKKRWPMSSLASQTVQHRLGRRLALENVSSYVTFADSQLSEWEFLSEVARRADCDLLLDINNVYVSARNHGFDRRARTSKPSPSIASRSFIWPATATRELICSTTTARWSRHPCGRCIGAPFRDSARSPTIIEWDENVPSIEALAAEVEKARASEALAARSRRPGVAGGGMTLESASGRSGTRCGSPPCPRNRSTGVFAATRDCPHAIGCRSTAAPIGPANSKRCATSSGVWPIVRRTRLRRSDARSTCVAHPSPDPRIEGIGGALPRFLRAHQLEERQGLADLAAFEWAEVEALLAADPLWLTTGFDVPAAVFPACTLEMVPALRVVAFTYRSVH